MSGQVIAPEVWQEGIENPALLPGRYTTQLFTGKGVNIANNTDGPNSACRVWDMQITDYITDYDDRRLNGLAGTNTDGHDGWGASAYGVFQDVRFDSRVYTMGRHRSVAFRLFDEMQYDKGIGNWGTATQSGVITNGQSLMKTAALISKAKDRWQKQILGPDIDKYNMFCAMNGHISGRAVGVTQDINDQIFTGNAADYEWIAQPGAIQGEAIPPRFAPIHCVEWDNENIPAMLQDVKVTWNNMRLEQANRVLVIDPYYELQFMQALTGQGIPVTEKAYADVQNGSFTRLMGWDIQFDIPSEYFPKLYVDDNLNVVHSRDGRAAYDAILNSVSGDGTMGKDGLLHQLVEAGRMSANNFVKTVWDNDAGRFVKYLSNYPLGVPATAPYLGEKYMTIDDPIDTVNAAYTANINGTSYPFSQPGAGYGVTDFSSEDVSIWDVEGVPTGPVGEPELVQTIGMFLYKPAVQLSQEYSSMVTDEGRTRGKFTEMCMEVKYDAWVIEQYSHGVIPIIDTTANNGKFAIPVKIVEQPNGGGNASS